MSSDWLWDLVEYAERHPLGYIPLTVCIVYLVCDMLVDVLSGEFLNSQCKL